MTTESNTKHFADDLLNPKKVYTREMFLSKPCPVPSKGGVYAWFFRKIPPDVPIEGCLKWKELTLLYIGISPHKALSKKSQKSTQNLRKRIKIHFKGNASKSTLRMSLGCLLSNKLNISLRRIGKSERFRFLPSDEDKLSNWMAENALVTWKVSSQPWIVEDKLIHEINVPLNLQGNRKHPFHNILSSARKLLKKKQNKCQYLFFKGFGMSKSYLREPQSSPLGIGKFFFRFASSGGWADLVCRRR